MARTKKDLSLIEQARLHGRRCDQPDCAEPGLHRAPRSRDSDAPYWFCLEHVRAYNASWNFFAGMTPDQIELYVRANAVGQRPTWRIGTRPSLDFPDFVMSDDLGLLGELKSAAQAREDRARRAKSNGKPADPRLGPALAALQLEPGVTLPQIKARFKELVKRYHPDANGGDKRAEERLKSIISAYSYLVAAVG
jgi:hypothetical protein